jgi:hypothetical protein
VFHAPGLNPPVILKIERGGESDGVCLLNEAAARRTGLDILWRAGDSSELMRKWNVKIKFGTGVSGNFCEVASLI